MLHGNVLHADGTAMRKLPKNDGRENYNSHHLKDGQAAIVQRTTGENESKEGYEWALVRLKETHQMIGWIKAQNLHMQLN